MSKLAKEKCNGGEGHAEALQGAALSTAAQELSEGWKVIKKHHLEKEYKFRDFNEALAFTNKVGALAEKIQHHPDIYLAWGMVKLTLWTHSVDGLTEGDFKFASEVDKICK